MRVVGALAALFAVPLVGCAANSEALAAPTSTPSSTLAPRVDAEALEAEAEVVFGRYVQISSQILRAGAHDPSPLQESMTEDLFERSKAEFAAVSDAMRRSSGDLAFDSFEVQRIEPDGTVHAYVCFDVTSARVLNAFGQDVTPSDRRARQPLAVTFELVDDVMKLSGSDVWSGADFC
jgi:hypothetical protein